MKKALLFFPVVLSLVVLAAHFMRYGNTPAMAGSLALVALLFVRKAWVARLMQVVLVLGALEWVRTLLDLVQVRTAMGEPTGRMVIILGIVAAITACSALVFQSKSLKQIYGLVDPERA